MNGTNEMEVLAKIRTLLALERNYLAEERTALAEFRTGLALVVIGPTIGAIIAYMISVFNLEQSTLFDVLNFVFFSIMTIGGLWIAYKARIEFRRARQKRVLIKKRTLEVSKSSKEIFELLSD